MRMESYPAEIWEWGRLTIDVASLTIVSLRIFRTPLARSLARSTTIGLARHIRCLLQPIAPTLQERRN
ncbi:hypothetical protein LMTR13_25375 [Bradyrhizobium icense]|uniref:Uncharacterized protein n=1 Tax=Bradyrhizobium icense TaxID=1274631 RepID=A0A1B1UJP0_9BRAD|nr:hypothetical protein LMTR13_25375 [Bradyrhizobium icense]